MSNKIKTNIYEIVLLIILFLVFLTVVIPYIWTVSNAFRFNDEIGVFNNLGIYTFIPKRFTFTNFKRMFDQLNMWRIILNTLLVAFSTTFISLFINSITGYSLGQLDFIGKNFIFGLLLIGWIVLLGIWTFHINDDVPNRSFNNPSISDDE